jgi:hypothetical protein
MAYKLKKPIHIKKGQLLEQACNSYGGKRYVELSIPLGKDFAGCLLVQVHKDAIHSGFFEEVE